MFAKDEQSKMYLQKYWSNFEKRYVAVVEGKPENKKGVLKNYLSETKTHFTYIVNNSSYGKLAITEYEEVLSNKKYTLLDLNLKTGRKNQIRVQLSNIGCPIIGDKKYGDTKDIIRRMALHSYKLIFTHPKTKKAMIIETDIPDSFIKMFK